MKFEKGFTLIEVMITIAIITVIAVAVYNAYFGSLRAWNYNKSRLEVQRVQDLTHRWISKYVKQSVFVNPNYSNDKFTEDGNKLYLEYIDDNGIQKSIAFGRENSTKDYLYFYDIDNDVKRKISDLKFTELSFDYDYTDDIIKVTAEIFNENESSSYKFSSYFISRFPEIVTP